MDRDISSFLLAYDRSLPLETRVSAVTSEAGVRLSSLSFLSVHGQRVPALLALPERPGAAPAVLVQHGGGDSKDERHILLVVRRLAAAGFGVLAIDAPAHGERAHSGDDPLSPARRRLYYQQRDNRIQNVIDLRRGIDLLERHAAVDGRRIGYWGISMGASIGVALAAVDERLRAACYVLGGASRRPAPEGVPPEHVELARIVLDPVRAASRLTPRPLLMLNGLQDPTVPADSARELFEALPEPKRIEWFPGGHQLSAGMIKASVLFFEEALGGTVSPPD